MNKIIFFTLLKLRKKRFDLQGKLRHFKVIAARK